MANSIELIDDFMNISHVIAWDMHASVEYNRIGKNFVRSKVGISSSEAAQLFSTIFTV
jgi:hypothetical protein